MNWRASAQTSHYCSPLQAAAYSGSLSTVQLLLELGAEAESLDEGYFGTALTAAVSSTKRTLELITALINAGADVNQVSPEACQLRGFPLVHAVKLGDMECAQLLLDSGADVNIQSGTMASSIQMAATLPGGAMLELLVQRGADVNVAIEPEDLSDQIETEAGLQEGPNHGAASRCMGRERKACSPVG